MRRLILDHLRRWRWLLLLVLLGLLVLGWFLPSPAGYPRGIEHSALRQLWNWFKVETYLLEMNLPFVAMCAGAFLLFLDLQRGLVRPLATLPLSPRQIGRGWWLATVAVPAVVLPLTITLGAGLFVLVHPDQAFPAARLAKLGLLLGLWLGTNFAIYFNFPALPGVDQRRQRLGSLLTTAIVIWMFFGYALAPGAEKHPVKFGIYLGAGFLMTLVGWFRAEHFGFGRGPHQSMTIPVGQPLPRRATRFVPAPGRPGERLTPLEPRPASQRPLTPAGSGGLAYLITTTFKRGFGGALFALTLMALVLRLQGQRFSGLDTIALADGIASIAWLLILLYLLPVLQQTRALRVLPISSARLALVLLVLGGLPLLAIGAVQAAVTTLASGAAADALAVLRAYAFHLAPTSLCIWFGLWRGTRFQTYALVLLTLAGYHFGWRHIAEGRPELPLHLPGLAAAGCVLLAWLLIRYTLDSSRRIYQVHPGTLGQFSPWGTT